MRTTWTACVRSEQQYDMCSRLFLNNEKMQDARHSYELFGREYLRRRKLLNRGSYMSAHVLLNLLNELGKKIRCEALPINTWVAYRSDMVQVRLS